MEALQLGDPPFAGPYRLLGRLGSGGMGRVFLGQSPGGRLVAVKVIRAELVADPGVRTRFAREVLAAQTVGGLFTAQVADADVTAPEPWLATAYIDGPSLANAVAAHGPLPVPVIIALAPALAEGLAAIHSAGLAHRDLTPSNVLLARDGPRVIDFGISKAAEASVLTGTGTVIGSAGFMSPEQAEGHNVGPASDIFSLGSVITFASAGQGPFGTGSAPALLYRVVHNRPDTEAVPALIRPLIERCLAKDPAERPTAAQLLQELNSESVITDWLAWLPTQVDPAIPLGSAVPMRTFAMTAPAAGPAEASASHHEPNHIRRNGNRIVGIMTCIAALAVLAVLGPVVWSELRTRTPATHSADSRTEPASNHRATPPSTHETRHGAASVVKCGLLTCSHGRLGEQCTADGYPGIIVQVSQTKLGCDPHDNYNPSAAPATTSLTASCQIGWVNIPAGSGEPVSSKTFSLTPPAPDTADGYSLADYEAMQLTIGARQTVSVGSVTVVWYDSAGTEINSGTANIGQVITAGQHLTLLYDESLGSDPNPPLRAATCNVVNWSQ